MAWIVYEDRLDPHQREFLERADFNNHNIWIKGFPGSGKSVLLAHTVKRIKNRTPNATLVFLVFTRSLVEMFKAAFRELGITIDVTTYYDFMKSSSCYDYVLADEVQDFVPKVLTSMKTRGNRVVVAGDEHQSIYSQDPRYGESTIPSSELVSLLSARTHELLIIHRLSSSIIDVIQRFMPETNIFSSRRDQTNHSTQVRLCTGQDEKEEVKYVMQEAMKSVQIGYSAAVLLPTQKEIIKFINTALQNAGEPVWNQTLNNWGKPDFASLNRHLSSHGIDLQYVGNGYGSLNSNDRKVMIMTYHSAKGLDFENVFLPFMNNHQFIVSDEQLSKRLFMVAMSRSRNKLSISYTGRPHHYLQTFSSRCYSIDISQALNSSGAFSASTEAFGDNLFGDNVFGDNLFS